jgi:hypothetical protein
MALAGCGDDDAVQQDASTQADSAIDDATPADASTALACEHPSPGAEVVYLSFDGGDFKAGTAETEDPSTNTGVAVIADGTLSSALDPTRREAVVACVRKALAGYDIRVTTDEPAALPYHEIAYTDSSSTAVGGDAQIVSNSGFACGGQPDSLSIVFHAAKLDDPFLCEVAVNRVSLAVAGITWVMRQDDYASNVVLSQPGPKSFHDLALACGELEPYPCRCGGSELNPHQLMLARFGACP